MECKVQMIYIDPPYGIKYASNFQASVGKRDAKDIDEDLTREPEQIKAYRDTWELGVHSWLTYMRDRLFLARELLHETGSIFVQINDENVHRVRCLLDEVFGAENFVSQITYRTKNMTFGAKYLETVADYLLWYAKDKSQVKYHPLFRKIQVEGDSHWNLMEFEDGRRETMTPEQVNNHSLLPPNVADTCQLEPLYPAGVNKSGLFTVRFRGKDYSPPPGKSWKTFEAGMRRVIEADRLEPYKDGKTIRYVLRVSDHPVTTIPSLWADTPPPSRRSYVVETSDHVIERCILMTTDPGDLVFDPTCGSGTTAFCAERWKRRWITCDTSRVSITLARERLMTAKFDYYQLANADQGFIYESAPHVMFETIANNTEIDEIGKKYRPQITSAIGELNRMLNKTWEEWEIPREAANILPEGAKSAHKRFWSLQLQKRAEIDASIERSAEQLSLYDHPMISRGIVRVSGPFTVEAIPVPAVLEQSAQQRIHESSGTAEGYADLTIELLRKTGVIFPGGKQMALENLRPVSSASFVHAEGETTQNGGKLRVAVSLGPRYGPITAKQVDEAIRSSYKMGFDLLIFAGFAFDPEAQATIQKNPIPKLRVQMAHISPDVIVGAYSDRPLLKTTKSSQLFTVFGEPDVKLEKNKDEFKVRLLGVDLYDPTTGNVHSSNAGDIPAWFLDEDYDGYTFRTCQAFFPREATARNPWDRLENALRSIVDKEKMEKFRGTESLPFKAGPQGQIAVKVIDIRGNEVMVVKSLSEKEQT